MIIVGRNKKVEEMKESRRYAMSPMQQGMFFHDMLTEDHIYYEQVSFDIKGKLNVAVFTGSVQLLVDSHEALRMNYYISEEKSPQLGIPDHRKQEVIYCDLSALTEEEQRCEIHRTAEKSRDRNRDLAQGDIMDMHLFCVGEDRHRLLWGCHHIAIDGWCMSLMIKELFEIYDKAMQGTAQKVEEVPYSDYLSWLETRENDAAKSYWENYLKDVPAAYQFPHETIDALQTKDREVMRLTLDENQMERLKKIAADTHITVGALIQGIWGMLVCKYSGQSEAVWGSVTSGRSVPIPNIDKIIGLFINTMPIILRLEDEKPLPEQIRKLGVDLFQAEFNSSVQLSEISAGKETLFRHIFAFENLEFADMIDGVSFGGLELANANFVDRTNYDLTVKAQPTDQLLMDFEYNPSVYRSETMEDLLKAYKNLMTQLILNPARKVKEYKLLSEEMETEIVESVNEAYYKYEKGTFQEGFLKAAENYGTKWALIDDTRKVTYEELLSLSKNVAVVLKRQGGKAGDLIAIDAKGSMDSVICIMGILMAGMAYLPIDASLPRKRRERFLEMASVKIIITDDPERYGKDRIKLSRETCMKGDGKRTFTRTDYKPEDLAYVLFTSGSTGEPKGVEVTTGALYAFCIDTRSPIAGIESDVVAQVATLAFDASVYEIFTTLLTGGAVRMSTEKDRETAESLVHFYRNEGITRTFLTAQLFKLMVDEDERCFENMRIVSVGGEKVSAKHFYKAALACPKAKIINAYGPTEIVSIGVEYVLDPSGEELDNIPIGKPDAHHTCYVLDRNLHLCPKGVLGELYIGGEIGRGYYGRTDMTKERFISNPYRPDEIIYKTGDIVSVTADGTIVYVGREDDQVKIRGFRIEAGEIENVLQNCEGISQGFVKIVKNEAGEWRIWAYYLSKEEISHEVLKEKMAEYLPSYMLPNGYMRISQVPLTKNGKLDRKKLPDIEEQKKTLYILPETELQQKVLRIWQEVLGNPDIGIRHNFFEAGGDSIKAMQIVGMMKKEGMTAELRRLFEHPTVEKFVNDVYMGELESQEAIMGEVPLLPIQKAFFDSRYENQNQFNQSVLLKLKKEISVSSLERAMQKITEHHDTLRMIYTYENGSWKQEIRGVDAVSYHVLEATYEGTSDEKEWIDQKIEELQGGMDLEDGVLMNLGILRTREENYLFVAVHHLVMDGVSFRILLRDLGELLEREDTAQGGYLIPKTVSYQKFAKEMMEKVEATHPQLAAWEKEEVSKLCTISTGHFELTIGARKNKVFTLESEIRRGLEAYVRAVRTSNFADVLLAICMRAIGDVTGLERFAVEVEHNGRNFGDNRYDLSNTIGWFTAIYPLIFDARTVSVEESVQSIAKQQKDKQKIAGEFMLQKIYGEHRTGIYGIQPEICFNYLGEFDSVEQENGPFEVVVNGWKGNRFEKQKTPYLLEINALSMGGSIHFMVDYAPEYVTSDQIGGIVHNIMAYAEELKNKAEEKIYEPFGLSSLQMAYFIGKQDFYELGGFTTHNYIEFVTRADIPRMNKVLNRLVQHQEMLRTVILPDGRQRVLKDVPYYEIKIEDISSLSKEEKEEKIKERRNQLSHAFFDIQHFPLFEIRGFKMNEEEKYLFINYDTIMMDSASMNMMVQDLAYGYFHPEYEPEPLRYHYRDFIHDFEAMKEGEAYEKAKSYWMSKLEDFPEAPQLPLRCDPETIERGHFIRKRRIFSRAELDVMKKQSTKHRMTISALLMSAYGHVLQFYSGMDAFTVNLTLFNRPSFHPDIEKLYGDFTTSILLDFGMSGDDFWKESEKVQQTLSKALEYRAYDGIHFSKDVMKKFRYPTTKALMPIVFTSLLFEQDIWDDVNRLGEVKWSIGQTPQVYIDFQVMSEGGNLVIQMDYVSELFEAEMMEHIFGDYCGILEQVAEGKEEIAPLSLPEKQKKQRLSYNNTKEEHPRETTLIQLFMDAAGKYPDKVALIYGEEKFTYAMLNRYSNNIAEYLEKEGLEKKPIGLFGDRKPGAIINLLGILKAGGCYVPMLPDFPKERVNYICESSQIERILYPFDYLRVPEAETTVREHLPEPTDLAYVLYTSGSTGRPKGVEIINRTVANTMIAANEAYGVGEEDVFIGLSAMSFDMSVYDIFGCFEAGGTLVMVPDVHAIEHIAELIETNHVTVWQTVPSLMQMYLTVRKTGQGNSLRHILLGGDFIPKQLARDILEQLPKASFMSVGGPTETSVFDIYYPVSEVKEEWNSIPYGYPLKNQQIYIMDAFGRELPNEVKGEICVGGMCLAKGYVNMPKLNAEKFFEHPEYGRIFRTGDYGIFKNEGYVEICGRIDGQIKIHGYRIELGEIENVYLKHPDVTQAAALIYEGNHGSRHIAVFVETDPDRHSEEEFREYGASYLTTYMRPTYLKVMKQIPLTPNNKIDRRGLLDGIDRNEEEGNVEKVLPKNEIEEKLLMIWKNVLNVENAGVEDDFFESGGDSLKAMELLTAIKKSMKWEALLLTDVLKSSTIRKLAEFYMTGKSGNLLRELAEIREGLPKLIFVHGGNGSADSYQKMVDIMKDRYNCYGIDYLKEVALEPEKLSLQELAREYAASILECTKKEERIQLVGWCIGGTICFEIARILEASGYQNIHILFLDTQEPGRLEELSYNVPTELEFMKKYAFRVDIGTLKTDSSVKALWESVVDKISGDERLEDAVKKSFFTETAGVLINQEKMSVREMIMIHNFFRSIVDAAEKVPVSGRVHSTDACYIHASSGSAAENPQRWQNYFDKKIEFLEVDSSHFGLIQKNCGLCCEGIREN